MVCFNLNLEDVFFVVFGDEFSRQFLCYFSQIEYVRDGIDSFQSVDRLSDISCEGLKWLTFVMLISIV